MRKVKIEFQFDTDMDTGQLTELAENLQYLLAAYTSNVVLTALEVIAKEPASPLVPSPEL